MNIFILDRDPLRCAQFHCDDHVNKMILESCQMLSTAWHVLDGYCEIETRPAIDKETGEQKRRKSDGGLMFRKQKVWRLNHSTDIPFPKPTHINHGCNRWVRSHAWAYIWLWHLTHALTEVKAERYGKPHLYTQNGVLDGLATVPPSIEGYSDLEYVRADKYDELSPSLLDDHPPYMGVGDTNRDDFAERGLSCVEGYREFYVMDKARFAEWKYSDEPYWWNPLCCEILERSAHRIRDLSTGTTTIKLNPAFFDYLKQLDVA